MSYVNSSELRAQAAQLRSMASDDAPPDLKLDLIEMAERYEQRARAVDGEDGSMPRELPWPGNLREAPQVRGRLRQFAALIEATRENPPNP
ncbi:hypothetical protein [Sphingomonas rustica]